MISFLFPEDLDPQPVHYTPCTAPRSKKLQEAFPVASTRARRPVPIMLPPSATKPKDDVMVSITRLSLDERPSRLAKRENKKPLMRWRSATLGKEEKQERQMRMALAEAERSAHEQARAEKAWRDGMSLRPQLPPLAEERSSRHSSKDYDVTQIIC